MEDCWPKTGDYQDHIRWFKEKNPTAPSEAASNFAAQQMNAQIKIWALSGR